MVAKSSFLSLALALLPFFGLSQNWEKGNPLHDLLRSDAAFEEVVSKKEIFEPQVIFMQIDRDETNAPSFRTWTWNVDPARYFYPASTVKLPTAIAALEWLNHQKIIGLDRKTPVFHGAGHAPQVAADRDSSNLESGGLPTVEHYVKKILLVSDNDAFNRLYELMGQDQLNRTLRGHGMSGSRIVHRLDVTGYGPLENRYSNPVRFIDRSGKTLFERSELYGGIDPALPLRGERQGKGFYRGDSLSMEPFDFSKKNFYGLMHQISTVRDLIFPPPPTSERFFDIAPDDRRFLLKYMSMWPRESISPRYDVPDGYCKFFVLGGKDSIAPPGLRIFNKVGDAYGFLLDAAYIVDFETKTEFLLAAVVRCNSDGIFNDDRYDYELIGFPFFKNLGQKLLEQERKRPKKRLPDLDELQTIRYRE